MKPVEVRQTRKRAVNLFLNEDLVAQAKTMTDNLSAEVESLLAAYIHQHQRQRDLEVDRLRRSAKSWNDYADKQGSFADEFSTL